MPVHDWSRVDADLFHDFHQAWSIGIRNALNGGLLPKGYSALVGQHAYQSTWATCPEDMRAVIEGRRFK